MLLLMGSCYQTPRPPRTIAILGTAAIPKQIKQLQPCSALRPISPQRLTARINRSTSDV
jgi:hypothetical protein